MSEYDLSNVKNELLPIVQILLDNEFALSDGYVFYCSDIDGPDETISTLVSIAQKIYDAIVK
jgi:hypothetical protein